MSDLRYCARKKKIEYERELGTKRLTPASNSGPLTHPIRSMRESWRDPIQEIVLRG